MFHILAAVWHSASVREMETETEGSKTEGDWGKRENERGILRDQRVRERETEGEGVRERETERME